MATITIPREYEDGEILVESDLDAANDAVETFLNTTKINDDNIQNSGITGSTKLVNATVTEAKLATDSVSTLKIVNEAVTNPKIGADAVNGSKIADDAIDSEHYVDGSIDPAHLADLAVTTAKINDLAVTTGKIASGAVTQAKRADLGQQLSSTATFSTTSASYVDITNLSVSIATTGRPVFLILQASGSSLSNFDTANASTLIGINFVRGSTVIAEYRVAGGSTDANWPSSSVSFVDTPSAGTHTYKCQMKRIGTSANCWIRETKLLAFEL